MVGCERGILERPVDHRGWRRFTTLWTHDCGRNVVFFLHSHPSRIQACCELIGSWDLNGHFLIFVSVEALEVLKFSTQQRENLGCQRLFVSHQCWDARTFLLKANEAESQPLEHNPSPHLTHMTSEITPTSERWNSAVKPLISSEISVSDVWR